MNLANKITITRIALIPVVILFLAVEFRYSNYIAALIFIIAASTDSVDGYVARKRNEVTNFGKFADPLADKLLVMATLIVLVEMGRIPSWITIIIISREVIITGFRALAATEGIVIAASYWGKIKTITQIIAIAAIMLNNMPFRWIDFPFDMLALYIAALVTIISGIDYINKNIHLLNDTIR